MPWRTRNVPRRLRRWDAAQAVADLQAEVSSLLDQLADAQSAADEANSMLDDTKAELADAMDAAAEAGEAAPAGGGNTLATVQERGTLLCGTGGGASPGFAFIQEDGSWEGFNVDFCKVIATAVLGDPEAIEPIVTTGTTASRSSSLVTLTYCQTAPPGLLAVTPLSVSTLSQPYSTMARV